MSHPLGDRLEGAGTTPQMEGAPYTTPAGEVLLVRHCRGLGEFQACVDVQNHVWGYEDREATPRKGFVLASELGGQVIGAFDRQGTLAGFAMAMPAFESIGAAAPALYLHSHMLAVLPPYRRSGLGTRLKLVQREDALGRGIVRMTWTFDPLAAKNAALNLHKLGAIARRYSPDFYGVSSSRLQGGLPSDRLHAEWWLGSDRVNARAAALLGNARSTGQDQDTVQTDERACGGTETIALPHEIEQWRQDGSRSRDIQAVQSGNRERFLEVFARGLAAVDFSLDASGNGCFHLADWQHIPPPGTYLRSKESL